MHRAGRPRQGPVLRARRADPGPAAALAVPARRHPQAGGTPRGRAARGLLVADKPDSHDICFVADGDNAGWLREKLGERAPNHGGDIVDDATGEVLGRHDGTYAFTDRPAQGPAARRAGAPTASRASCSTSSRSPAPSRVGPREALTVDRIDAASGRAGAAPSPSALEGTVQLRAHGAEHRAVVVTVDDGDRVEIELLDPAQGIAPGQAAVMYDGTRVVGSATIESTTRAVAVELRRDPA